MIQRARQCHGPKCGAKQRAGGFTLVEMLIVIAIIIILLGILLVGLNHATKTAQTAHTKALMTSIRQGLVRFKEDVGYYPPVLGVERELIDLPNITDLSDIDFVKQMDQWYSWTSLGEYLVGYGHQEQDGYGYKSPAQGGPLYNDENPPVGIRHPGHDGVWNSTSRNGTLADRFSTIVPPQVGGKAKVYGPYLELDNDRLLGSLYLSAGEYKIAFPGEANYDATAPKVIVDYWGNPISYYRRLYPEGALTQSYRPNIDYDLDGDIDERDLPTLSDVVTLRPWELEPGQGANRPRAKDEVDDPTTSILLESAEFALFSPGPDQTSDREKALEDSRRPHRVDPDDYNRDNIVEVGP